jgi:hypothetical protein
MRAVSLLVLLMLLPPLSSHAQAAGGAQPTDAKQPLPVDTRKNWSVAFTAFTPQGLAPQETYLAFSIPLLLKDQVSALAAHSFSAEERLVYQKQIVSRELDGLYQSLSQLRQQRDETLFVATSDRKAVEAAEKRLSDALDRIRWLEDLDPALIVVEKEKPLQIKEGTGVGNLFDPPKYSPYQYAVQQDVDLLIGGTATDVQGYILIDLWAYASASEQVVYTFRDAAQPEGIYASLTEAAKGLIGVMLGREWSSLTLVPDPLDSMVTIDGTSMGAGRIQTAYLTPGSHTIVVSAPGYTQSEVETELASFEERVIPIALQKVERPRVSLSSSPPGADVYLDSVWIGTTPLTLEAPAVRTRLELDLDGYYSMPTSLGPSSPPQLVISLTRDVASRDALQKKARDEFYVALGFFALSLPIPFFCYSYSNDYKLTYVRLLADENPSASGAATVVNIFVYSYYSSLGVSASLFTWMIVDLVRYIAIANRTAG